MAAPARLPAVEAKAILESATGQVLIVRNRTDDVYADRWTFPGGPVGSDESPEAALRRHLRERLGVEIEIQVGQPPFVYEIFGQQVTYRYYICGIIVGEPATNYWPEVRWVGRVQLSEYDFDPPAKQVADWLMEQDVL